MWQCANPLLYLSLTEQWATILVYNTCLWLTWRCLSTVCQCLKIIWPIWRLFSGLTVPTLLLVTRADQQWQLWHMPLFSEPDGAQPWSLAQNNQTTTYHDPCRNQWPSIAHLWSTLQSELTTPTHDPCVKMIQRPMIHASDWLVNAHPWHRHLCHTLPAWATLQSVLMCYHA